MRFAPRALAASQQRLLEQRFHDPVCLTQGGVQGSGIFTTSLGQIRATAAFAADSLCDPTNHCSGLHASGQILGHADDEGHAAICSRPQHHDARPDLSRS